MGREANASASAYAPARAGDTGREGDGWVLRHRPAFRLIQCMGVLCLFITVKKWTALYILCFVVLFAGFAAILWQGSAVQASRALEPGAGGTVLIIDPGHGGEDGGAVAADGTCESQINLAVSLRLEAIARLVGMETAMTRREDVSTTDMAGGTVRERKISDLKNRTAFCNAVPGGVLVSVHQNSLPGAPGVHGAQMFYGGVQGSEALALTVQNALNAVINRERPKVAKTSGDAVYLLKNAACPAVLVECGFLSNSGETEKLKTADYQTRLALTVLAGVRFHLTAPAEPPAAL